MALRHWVHEAGRILTRALLHPRWRHRRPIAWSYLQLYLLGKRITERRELAALRRLVLPGMIVADVGANVGFYALQMASCVGPRGRVLAFEPDPLCFGLLRSRIKRSGGMNVDAHQLALGEGSGEAILYCSAYNRADNRLSPSHAQAHVEEHRVQVRSLDEFLAAEGISTVDALKIDVQGSEERVLKGARRTIEGGLDWIWVEFSPDHLRGAGTDPRSFLALLADMNMDVFEVDDGRLQRLSDTEAYIGRIGSGYGDLLLLSRDDSRRTGASAGRDKSV
jgi:FkbM family methyltransferase